MPSAILPDVLPSAFRLRSPRRPSWGLVAACLLLAGFGATVGCGDGGGSGGEPAVGGALPLRSVDPPSGAGELGPATLFVLGFDGGLDPATVEGRVSLRAAGRELPLRLHSRDAGGGASELLVDPAELLPAGAPLELELEPGVATSTGVLDRRVALSFRVARRRFAPQVRFDPLGGELRPFPSDLHTVADPSRPSGRRIQVLGRSVPAFLGLDSEGEVDGFDPSSRVVLGFTGEVDPTSLPTPEGSGAETASVLLVRADPADARFGEPAPFLARVDGLGLALDPPDPLVMLRPLEPLEPATRYAAVVTRRVRGIDGAPLEPAPGLADLLAGRETRRALAPYGAMLTETLEALSARLPLGAEDVAGITVFTTATEEAMTGRLERIADRLFRTAERRPPRFRVDSIEQRDDQIRVLGHMTSYELRGAAQTFLPERYASVPLPAPEVELEVFLVLPLDAPRAPVVLFGHGINSRKEQAGRMAGVLARRGIATVAIDFVEHGSRYTGSTIPALSFLSIDYLPGGRDNARQTVVDLLQLVRLVERDLGGLDVLPLGRPDGIPDVDGGRIAYLGESFGAIHGAMVTALEPSFRAAALVVGGGTWTDVAYEFPPLSAGNDGFDLVGALADLTNLPVGEVLTLLQVGQQVLTPGDPLAYARRVLGDRFERAGTAPSLLQVEVIGDAVVPNLANESLARAIGLPLLEPTPKPLPGVALERFPARANGPAGTTIGLVQYQRFSDGRIATHDNVLAVEESQDLVAGFLEDALAERIPRIDVPLDRRAPEAR